MSGIYGDHTYQKDNGEQLEKTHLKMAVGEYKLYLVFETALYETTLFPSNVFSRR